MRRITSGWPDLRVVVLTLRRYHERLRMCSSKKANTSGSQMLTPRKGKSCPSSARRERRH